MAVYCISKQTQANFTEVAPPPKKLNSISGCPKVASYEMLGKHLQNSNQMKQKKQTLVSFRGRLGKVALQSSQKNLNIAHFPILVVALKQGFDLQKESFF